MRRVLPRNLSTSSDELVLERIRAGDQRAVDELFRRHAPGLRHFVRSISSEDAEDIVLETFGRTLAAIERGHGPRDNPGRYLRTAARRNLGQVRAVRDRQRRIVERMVVEARRSTPAPVLLDDDLATAYRSLSDRWRQVLWWAEVEGRTPAEIGEELGLSADAASALAYRARRALREAYAPHR